MDVVGFYVCGGLCEGGFDGGGEDHHAVAVEGGVAGGEGDAAHVGVVHFGG